MRAYRRSLRPCLARPGTPRRRGVITLDAPDHLPGVEDPVGVEEPLQRAVPGDEVAMLAREVAELAEPDAVLSCARAAAFERPLDDLVVQPLRSCELARVVGVEQKVDVEV